jgi:hypothetical protein
MTKRDQEPRKRRKRRQIARWRTCGHVRDRANTRGVSPAKPDGQCRECWNAWRRQYREDLKAGRRAYAQPLPASHLCITCGTTCHNRVVINAPAASEE